MSDCTDVERAFAKHGVLLLQDKVALDVVGMLAGEKLSASVCKQGNRAQPQPRMIGQPAFRGTRVFTTECTENTEGQRRKAML